MKETKKICICGGGSLGLVCTGVFLDKGYKVDLLTGHPDDWSNNIQVYDSDGRTYSGTLDIITSKPEEVIPRADLILLTLPGFMIEKTLEQIQPYLNADTIVGSIVSSTGFFFAAHKILGKTNTLFGFQRVPYIARQKTYGQIGELLGYKPTLNVCIEYSINPEALKKQLEKLFNTPITLLNNFYEASLTNSNPILHTGRLYSLWKDYNGKTYDKAPLFYADWTDEASEYIIEMDREFQVLLDKLEIPKGVIPTLLDYYESTDAQSLTKKIRSIKAFRSIKSPMIEIENGWIPDFKSRYFTEDFPFGLRYIKELAQQNGIHIPVINRIFNWGIEMIKSIK